MVDSPRLAFDPSDEVECRLRLRVGLDRGSPSPMRNQEVAGLLTFRHFAFVVDPILAIEFSDIARFRVDAEKALLQGVAEGRILHLEFEPSSDQDPDQWELFCVLLLLRVSGLSPAGKPFFQAVSKETIRQTGAASIQVLDELLGVVPGHRLARLWKARILLGLEKSLAALELLRPPEMRRTPESRCLAGLAALRAEKPNLAGGLIQPERSSPENLLQSWMVIRNNLVDPREMRSTLGAAIFLPMVRRPGGLLADQPWPESEQRLNPPLDGLFEGWLTWATGALSESEVALERYRRSPGADPVEVIRLEAALALASGNPEQAWNLLMMAAIPEFFRGRALLALRFEKERETLAAPATAFPQKPDGEDLWLLAALHLGAGNAAEAAELLKKASDEEIPDPVTGRLLRAEAALAAGEVDCAKAHLHRVRSHCEGAPLWIGDSLLRFRTCVLAAGILLVQNNARQALIELSRATALLEKSGTDRGREIVRGLRESAQRELERLEADATDQGNSTVLSAIERLSGRVDRVPSLEDLKPRARALVEDSRQPLLIAVMGECKAGKSTLMNALLGEDLLPTGSVPTTAIPWLLKPGSHEVALVHGRHGQVTVVAPRKLGEELPRLSYEPTRVEVFLPELRLKGLALVDTPGLNSLHEAHQDISEDFLEHADAILWVFDATQIGRRSEREVLRGLLPKNCPVLLAVNRSDEVEPDELAEVLAQAVELAGPGPGRGRAIAVSGRKARSAQLAGDEAALAASGFPVLLERLGEELESRSWTIKTTRLSERARDLLRRVEERRTADEARIGGLIERGIALREKVSGLLADWRSAFAPVIREWVRRGDLKETAEAAFRRETQEWPGARLFYAAPPASSPELVDLRKRVNGWLDQWVGEYLDFWRGVAEASDDRDIASDLGAQSGSLKEVAGALNPFFERPPDAELSRRLDAALVRLAERLADGSGRVLEHLAAVRASRDLLWFQPILELTKAFPQDP